MRSSILGLVLASCALAMSSENVTHSDLYRAIETVPRDHFKGEHKLVNANQVLNGHLQQMDHLKTRACETFSAGDLQELSRTLFASAEPALLDIYEEAQDNRKQVYSTLAEMETDFARLNKLVKNRDDLHDILRDGLCHRVVMWFVHHLPAKTQFEISSLIDMPFLPKTDRSAIANAQPEDSATEQIHSAYQASITCQKCHVGGIDNLGVAEVKPVTAKQLARRCYTNYKALFNITCGPCDGVAGAYWGDDDDKFFTADPCEIVGHPEDIAEADRVQPVFPDQFGVDVVAGSDRWGRTTNPNGHVKTPFPPILDSMYGQISGKWFVDITQDADVWLLRHDTAYQNVAFNGTHVPIVGFHVSEIHGQTKEQQAVNNTGQMVSLIKGLPSFIPGGCTCIADPVGVPDVAHHRTDGLVPESGMEFMGRIKLTLKEHNGEVVEVDHWANWFFHVFMETDKTVSHYAKAPKRLASAYAGTAVYDNWNLTDPKLADPTVWYRGIPTSPERVGPDIGKYCLNPQKLDMCNNISQTTWPPQPVEARTKTQQVPWHVIHRSFMPNYGKVAEHLNNL